MNLTLERKEDVKQFRLQPYYDSFEDENDLEAQQMIVLETLSENEDWSFIFESGKFLMFYEGNMDNCEVFNSEGLQIATIDNTAALELSQAWQADVGRTDHWQPTGMLSVKQHPFGLE